MYQRNNGLDEEKKEQSIDTRVQEMLTLKSSVNVMFGDIKIQF